MVEHAENMKKVQMNFGMTIDKLQSWIEFLGVNQGDQGQDDGKGRSGKHEFDHGQDRDDVETCDSAIDL